MRYIPVDAAQETLVIPFGLHLRQILQPGLVDKKMAQTTHEPEITNTDGNDPDKFDVNWYDDEDEEEEDDDDDSNKEEKCALPLTHAFK